MKILLDINTIPSDYRDEKSTKEIVKSYKDDFGVDIVPIDLSKKNIEGSNIMQPMLIRTYKTLEQTDE